MAEPAPRSPWTDARRVLVTSLVGMLAVAWAWLVLAAPKQGMSPGADSASWWRALGVAVACVLVASWLVARTARPRHRP
jgi:hypothetical protein